MMISTFSAGRAKVRVALCVVAVLQVLGFRGLSCCPFRVWEFALCVLVSLHFCAFAFGAFALLAVFAFLRFAAFGLLRF